MNEAEEANIANGLGISLVSKSGEVAGLGLARDKSFKDKPNYQDIAEIQLISLFFYEKYRKIEQKKCESIHLTPKEKDILNWACEGKTDEEIGIIMGIEVCTVRFHWNNIFRKLDVNSRVYAVTKALILKLIDPYKSPVLSEVIVPKPLFNCSYIPDKNTGAVKKMIKCVSIKNNHLFDGNPLFEQHRLRFNEISQRLDWDVPDYDGMEFDEYDTPATTYFLWSKPDNPVQVMCRTSPTSLPYMLQDHFNFLAQYHKLPSEEKVFEGSRMVADSSLSREERRQAIKEIVVAFMEFGRQQNLGGYVGIMPPGIWKSTFQKAGWDIEWIGEETILPNNGGVVRAAFYPVSQKMEEKIRETTKIFSSVLDYGDSKRETNYQMKRVL